MNYRDIINKLELLANNHIFIKQFGYGNLSDIAVPEDQEAPDYPYMFVNPVDVSVNNSVTSFNCNIIIMTQVLDTEDAEILGQSRCSQYMRDIVSYFTNSTNDPLYSISTPFTLTPFKERFQDDVVGVTANITIEVAEPLSFCDTPFENIDGIVSRPELGEVLVIDGDGRDYRVTEGNTFTCLDASPKSGIFYQRQLPWAQNDPGIDGSVFWHIGQGTYNYTPPSNPLYVAALPNNYAGNDTDSLLVQPNAFGNYYRFTNDVGEQFIEGFHSLVANNSSNPRYCIDHLSGLGWYVQDAPDDFVNRTIIESITYANNFSYAGFSDWRLADMAEYFNAANYHDYTNSYPGVYAPFVDPITRNYGAGLWTGTYTKDNQYIYVKTNGGTISLTTSTTINLSFILMVRNHYI